MNQGAVRSLIAIIIGAALLGALVLGTVPDYRQGKIIDTNRSYMPAVRVDNSDLPLAPVLAPTAAPEAAPTGAAPAVPTGTAP